jgi:hypothetical protein
MTLLLTFLLSVGVGVGMDVLLGTFPLFFLIFVFLWFLSLFKISKGSRR